MISRHPAYDLACWMVLAALILAGDYLTGPHILFPVFYLIPIALTAWTNGRWWGLFLAFLMPLVRVYFSMIWPVSGSLCELTINTAIRIVVLGLFAFLVDKVATQKRHLEKEIQMLRGILPICSFCKKIRNPDGNWEVLEQYISDRSDARFSHSICPDCVRTHYPEYSADKS